MNNNNTIKDRALRSPRKLPRVWKRIFQLNPMDHFFVGDTEFVRGGLPFLAAPVENYDGVYGEGGTEFVNPFRRVRTTVLVRDAKIGGAGVR